MRFVHQSVAHSFRCLLCYRVFFMPLTLSPFLAQPQPTSEPLHPQPLFCNPLFPFSVHLPLFLPFLLLSLPSPLPSSSNHGSRTQPSESREEPAPRG